MGNKNNSSIENKAERKILRKPRHGEASKFYWACRNGDLDLARQLADQHLDKQIDINQIELNGSTPLHAAVYYDHLEVVRFLLYECNCERRLHNRYGCTAYDEARTDEMRELFHRPKDSVHFDNQENINDMFQICSNSNDFDVEHDAEGLSDQWTSGYRNQHDIAFTKFTNLLFIKIFNTRMGRFFFKSVMKGIIGQEAADFLKNRRLQIQPLQQLINELEYDNQIAKCNKLLKIYVDKGRLDPLLQLYTLETEVYSKLHRDSGPLLLPLILGLNSLKSRFYQGKSYRGLRMPDENLRQYQWLQNHQGSMLETKTFSSSSINEEKAKGFIDKSQHGKRVLMILEFINPCETAINLGKISDKLPTLSDYPEEAEVLILPQTLFHVHNIEEDNDLTIIELKNVEQKSISELFQEISTMGISAEQLISSFTNYANQHGLADLEQS